MQKRAGLLILCFSAAWAAGSTAHAQTTPPDPAPPEAPNRPPPYSLPWQLRPAAAATALRSDTAVAFYDPAGGDGDSGLTTVSTLLFSYALTRGFAPLVRLGLSHNAPPDSTPNLGPGAVFLNPVLGATLALNPLPVLRVAFFLGVALPLGSGGGDSPDADAAQALARGVLARSAMDNAMFATNYLTPFPGIDVALVAHGFTLQAEATLLELIRVRGADHPADSQDRARTNFTSGLYAGYFVLPLLSLGAELRYQRFLKNDALKALPDGDARRDNLTFAVGPRLHLKLGKTTWLRPGVAFALGLDDPMWADDYRIVQLDLPLAF